MVRRYRCDEKCGHRKGSFECFIHLMKELIMESAEVLEASAVYDHRAIRYEFGDVIRILRAIGEYHPWTEEMMRLA